MTIKDRNKLLLVELPGGFQKLCTLLRDADPVFQWRVWTRKGVDHSEASRRGFRHVPGGVVEGSVTRIQSRRGPANPAQTQVGENWFYACCRDGIA